MPDEIQVGRVLTHSHHDGCNRSDVVGGSQPRRQAMRRVSFQLAPFTLGPICVYIQSLLYLYESTSRSVRSEIREETSSDGETRAHSTGDNLLVVSLGILELSDSSGTSTEA